MILKLSRTKRLSFYRKIDIYIGEKDFDKIQVLIPSEVDENDTSELTFKLHLVNERGEYAIRTLTVEQEGTKLVGSTNITADLTSIVQEFSVYIEMVKGNDEVIGKTNVLEIKVNPLPDEQGEIIPEEIEKRGVIIAQTNPPDSSHKKYRLGALWINYADETQYVLTDIDESQAPQEYGYVWNKVSNQTIISSDSAPEYTPNNVDYKYSVGDVWVQTDSNAEKIVAISVCTGNTKVTIDAQNWKYNYTWAVLTSGLNDYTDLTNKPSINNVTLSGNKTSDDLNLQDKLTAGQNITIDDNNVISAESGGVTSYKDLTDKPQIYVPVYNSFNELVGNENITIEDIINMTYGFCVRIDSQENKSLEPYNIYNHSLYSDKDLLVGRSISYYGKYDFDKLSNDLRCAGMWEAWASQCKHVPAFISDLFVSGLGNYIFFITHYRSHVGVAGGAPMIRSVAGKDKNGDFRIYYQYIRLSDNNDGTISNQSDWVELTGGGSQIVSGVVNVNGTITFTDSDGNTFTTSGSSVIGPQGDDYVLSEQDKSDIADIVLSELPTTQGVLYGN